MLGWMHGSFILINGSMENKATWDTGCLAVNFWFALYVCELNYINKGLKDRDFIVWLLVCMDVMSGCLSS
jgi:hypothetical protein